jgi:hypothetical protein
VTQIIIATPCFGGLVHQHYMLSILGLLCAPLARRVAFTLDLLGHDSLVTRSRNTLLARFLARPAATHLLFVDADIGFLPDQLERMLDFGAPVVAGVYPLKVLHHGPLADARRHSGEPAESAPLVYLGEPCTGAEAARSGGFVTARHAGTGFMLLRRDALERMVAAYPETRYRSIGAHRDGAATGEEPTPHHALFDCMIDPDTGAYLSEDFAFCRRWRALGGRIWLDTLGRLTHVGTHDYVGDPAVRFGG